MPVSYFHFLSDSMKYASYPFIFSYPFVLAHNIWQQFRGLRSPASNKVGNKNTKMGKYRQKKEGSKGKNRVIDLRNPYIEKKCTKRK